MRHHDARASRGLPPGEVGPQLCELELSQSYSDSSVASLLGVCLDGFNGDAWMSEAEEAQDDIQVGAAAGVNVSFRGARQPEALGHLMFCLKWLEKG